MVSLCLALLLQSQQVPVVKETVVVKGTTTLISTDPAANANAMVLKGADLDALSDDPAELEAQLRALAGAAGGAGGAQISIDGFSGGRLPAKSAIQEIRVNQNPYSAEYDAPGSARIEVITKAGGRSFHGRFLADANRQWMNSRNPFVADAPAYHSGSLTGTIDGPAGPKAAFSFTADRIDIRDASAVAAIALDAALNPVAIREPVPSRHRTLQIDPRVDWQLSRGGTLSARYRYFDLTDAATAVGQFALASRALNVDQTEHDVQLSATRVMGKRAVNEARGEYRQYTVDQLPVDLSPAVNVIGAFTGGGNPAGRSRSLLHHVELHDTVMATSGTHLLKVGGALRINVASERTAQNVNGTFTFTSLEAYRTTEAGLQAGLTPDAIRAGGGGASQFSIVIGQPDVHQTQTDAAMFVEDDWRAGDRLSIGAGLRYEVQSGITTRGDLAPRGSVAWAIGHAAKGRQPATVLRGGGGLFYDRVPQTIFVQSLRLDGIRSQPYVVAAPDFYPFVPPPALLAASRRAPIPYVVGASIAPPRTLQAGVTLERKIARGSTAAVGYLHVRGTRQLFSQSADGVYAFESGGRFDQDQLTVNLTVRPGGWFSLGSAYVLSSAKGDSAGAASFATNPAHLRDDYGRGAFDVRHHLTLFMGLDGPGFRVVPMVVVVSGQPFDITAGNDLNGDSIFNDRPAFATDLTRPSVVLTRYGAFDGAPLPGARIVPRNYGAGPAQAVVNLRVMKPFVAFQHDTIRVDLLAMNLFNRANLAPPVGSLASPVFGESTALAAGGASSSNRQFRVQLQFLF